MDESDDTNNRGVGLWVGYVIGIGWQDVGYLYIIASTDWQEIADRAQERQERTLGEKQGQPQALQKVA